MSTTTLRRLDPAVWAAAYAQSFADDYRAIYTACDGPGRHATALAKAAGFAPVHEQIADAAVRALHPEADGPDEPTPWTTGERLARATVHPEALRAPLPLPEAAPIPRVPGPPGELDAANRKARSRWDIDGNRPDLPRPPDGSGCAAYNCWTPTAPGFDRCALHGGQDAPTPGLDLTTPDGRLAHFEAAERAVLLAAGWTPATDPAGAWIDPVTHDWQPTRDAIGIQRDRDRDRGDDGPRNPRPPRYV